MSGKQKLLILTVVLLITALGAWQIVNFTRRYLNTKPVSFPERKSEVSFSLSKTELVNNNLVFEPVEFTVTNRLDRSIFYLHGCAVDLPSVERQINGESEPVIQTAICDSLPLVSQLLPDEKLVLSWDQHINGRLAATGRYRLVFNYTFNRPPSSLPLASEKWRQAYSDTLTVVRLEQTPETSQQICKENNQGFKVNGGYYPDNWCQKLITAF
jgi:hypothetical protein